MIDIDRTAPVITEVSGPVPAAPAALAAILLDVDAWPQWHSGVKGIRRDPGREGTPVELDETWKWKAGPGWVTSRLISAGPDQVAWTGAIMGIKAVHVWTLTSTGSGTDVVSAESWGGLGPRLLKGRMRTMLTKELQAFLDGLRSRATA